MPRPARDRLLLGRITGAHGLKGEVRLRSYTEPEQAIASYGTLQDASGERRLVIAALRRGRGGLIARIEGVADRSAAEALAGTELYAAREQLPALPENEWYHADLIGLVAVDGTGSALGQVVAVQNFGAGDLLEVRPATGGATVLVPFTSEIVPEIDVERGWLLMLPPPGLFE